MMTTGTTTTSVEILLLTKKRGANVSRETDSALQGYTISLVSTQTILGRHEENNQWLTLSCYHRAEHGVRSKQ